MSQKVLRVGIKSEMSWESVCGLWEVFGWFLEGVWKASEICQERVFNFSV